MKTNTKTATVSTSTIAIMRLTTIVLFVLVGRLDTTEAFPARTSVFSAKEQQRRHLPNADLVYKLAPYSQQKSALDVASQPHIEGDDSNSPSSLDQPASEDAARSSGKQSLSAATFNLVKAAVGSGVFALPAGVAAAGDISSTIIPASILIMVLGSLSAYSFHMIGRIGYMQKGENIKSISGAWKQEVGENTSWIISLSCLMTPLFSAMTFSIILGDLFSTFARSAGVTGLLASRQTALLAITSSVLYPLCNLSSLAALSPISMVGVLGMIGTCFFMMMRALPGGPYCTSTATGGAYLSTIAADLRPSFGVIGNKVFSPSILILVSMAATAFLVHFSAHEFCNDLENGSVQKFGLLTVLGFSLTALINVAIMASGFLTFGGNVQGMVLNNYSVKDIGATLCRIVVAISLIGGFPILVRAAKSAAIDLFSKGEEVSEKMEKRMTQVIVGGLTAGGLVLTDAGIIVSLSGAIMGSAIIYMFPSIIFLKLTSRLVNEKKMMRTRLLSLERLGNKFLIAMGAMIAVLGAGVTLLNTFKPGLI